MAMLWSVCLHAKDNTKHKNKKQSIAIGFQSGKNYTATSLFGTHNNTTIERKFTVRKTLGKHLKTETGINYLLKMPDNKDKYTKDPFKYLKPYRTSLPVSLQYYPFSEHKKVQPYCGLGLQYNFSLDNKHSNSYTTPTEMLSDAKSQQLLQGTKYISLFFTQGIIYEINTKIQVTQSFHFIPDNNSSTFGIDLGIGFTLP